jgi:hypothetical protein
VVFHPVTDVELGDGHTLIVLFQGEGHGWGCHLQGEGKTVSGASPADAIGKCLGYSPDRQPAWVYELSERLQRNLREAPRYVCACCGYRTLLNEGQYEICAVCRWEDDPYMDPDAESGPNRTSLNEARANFARLGASNERRKQFVREPRPEEYPP